jgi:hypothetical protein
MIAIIKRRLEKHSYFLWHAKLSRKIRKCSYFYVIGIIKRRLEIELLFMTGKINRRLENVVTFI